MQMIQTIQQLAEEKGFEACYFTPGRAYDSDLKTQGSLCLLIKAYSPFLFSNKKKSAEIDAYYFAAQKSYLAAKEMELVLQRKGINVRHTTKVLVKPYLSLLGDFVQLKSTLHAHFQWGTYFHVQTLWLEDVFIQDLAYEEKPPSLCQNCRLCEKACPTGAIDQKGYCRAKCLRSHMLSGGAVPGEMRAKMGLKLLGCDICQRVCPCNQKIEKTINTQEGEVDIEALLTLSKEEAKTLENKIGKNMAVPNRLLAQACLLAANTGEKKHINLLEKLTTHPSPVVREHALWAKTQLTNEA